MLAFLLANRSGKPKNPFGRGSPGAPQIGVKSRFSGVRFSGKSPNPNCCARALTLSGSFLIRFLMISGLAQIAGSICERLAPTIILSDKRFHHRIMMILFNTMGIKFTNCNL